jgi:hypothetical protein
MSRTGLGGQSQELISRSRPLFGTAATQLVDHAPHAQEREIAIQILGALLQPDLESRPELIETIGHLEPIEPLYGLNAGLAPNPWTAWNLSRTRRPKLLQLAVERTDRCQWRVCSKYWSRHGSQASLCLYMDVVSCEC